MGSIFFDGTPPSGPVHVVAYPASAFVNGIGPASGVQPVTSAVTFASPQFPISYQLNALPNGSLTVYAFVSVDNKTQSDVRACQGDLMGIASLMVVGGSPLDSPTNVVIQTPVNTTAFCQ